MKDVTLSLIVTLQVVLRKGFEKNGAVPVLNLHKNDEQIFVVTQNDTIISNTRSTFSEELILYCNTEEADTKLIRHCINLADQGYKHIVLRTVDSDVLVLMLAYSHVVIQWCNNNFCSIWCCYLQKVLQHY